jgi:hypothetical protein
VIILWLWNGFEGGWKVEIKFREKIVLLVLLIWIVWQLENLKTKSSAKHHKIYVMIQAY